MPETTMQYRAYIDQTQASWLKATRLLQDYRQALSCGRVDGSQLGRLLEEAKNTKTRYHKAIIESGINWKTYNLGI